MNHNRPHILLTNDDGIRSPGLWAAASALSEIGYVTVAAPREQSSGMGRSMPNTSDGTIREEKVQVNGREWSVFAVGGSPAQAVQHAILEIIPHKVDLVVSGINYGENVGTGITISGTVGAAMEASALGYRALAISLEADTQYHLSYSKDVDFSAAAYFTGYFAKLLLEKSFSEEVSLLKVDVPSDATPKTGWRTSRLSRQRYFEPVPPQRDSFDQPRVISYKEVAVLENEPEGTDVYVLRLQHMVAVTPITLDMTAPVDLAEFEKYLRE